MNHLRSLSKITSLPVRYFNNFAALQNKAINPAENTEVSQNIVLPIVPTLPVKSKLDLNALPADVKLDNKIIKLLEKLSLVDNIDGNSTEILEEAIKFAKPLLLVDVEGIDPLISVLEDEPLQTREDKVSDGNIREQILSNAVMKEEEYFVAPPGNIPIESEKDLLGNNDATSSEKQSN